MSLMGSSFSSVSSDIIEDDTVVHTLQHPTIGWPYKDVFLLRDMLRSTGYEDMFSIEWTDDRDPRVEMGDGSEVLTSGDAIMRFVGRSTHMYPSSCAVDAAVVDEWLDWAREFAVDYKSDRLSSSLEVHTKRLETALESDEWLGSFEMPSLADVVWVSHLKQVDETELSEILKDYCQRLEEVVRNSTDTDSTQ